MCYNLRQRRSLTFVDVHAFLKHPFTIMSTYNGPNNTDTPVPTRNIYCSLKGWPGFSVIRPFSYYVNLSNKTVTEQLDGKESD